MPPDENSPEAKAVLAAADDILAGARDQTAVEGVFSIAARVGVMLNVWRKTMVEGGFSTEWIETRATEIFHKFFPTQEARESQDEAS